MQNSMNTLKLVERNAKFNEYLGTNKTPRQVIIESFIEHLKNPKTLIRVFTKI